MADVDAAARAAVMLEQENAARDILSVGNKRPFASEPDSTQPDAKVDIHIWNLFLAARVSVLKATSMQLWTTCFCTNDVPNGSRRLAISPSF